MLNHPQMFPSEWKMIFYGSHCWTETTPPTCHTQRPHPLATPTGHTHQPHPSTDLPATPSSHFHYSYDSCVWWMGVSGRCVKWVCQVGVAHLPDTPTSHTYLLLLQPLPCVHATHVSGRCVRWACQVGVSGGRVRLSGRCVTPTYHTHMPQYRGISENLWQSSIRIIQNYIIDSTRL